MVKIAIQRMMLTIMVIMILIFGKIFAMIDDDNCDYDHGNDVY